MVSRDTIDLDTNDLTFCQHKEEDNVPSDDDFMQTIDDFMQAIVEEHLAWELKTANW